MIRRIYPDSDIPFGLVEDIYGIEGKIFKFFGEPGNI